MKARLLGLAAIIVCLAFPARAGQGGVEILIDLLEVDRDAPRTEPALLYVQERIQRTPFSLHNFRLLDSAAMIVADRESRKASFASPRPLEINVRNVGAEGDAVLLVLTIKSRGRLLLNTEVTLTKEQAVLVGVPDPERTIMLAVSLGL